MNFIKLSFFDNETIKNRLFPVVSLTSNGAYLENATSNTPSWVNTLVVLSSGVELFVVETAEEIIALLPSGTIVSADASASTVI